METLKKNARNFLRYFPVFRLMIRKAYGGAKKSNYKKIAEKTEIDPKLILFEVFMGRQYACNLKAIYEYIISDSRFDDYTLVWAFRDVDKGNSIPQLQRAKIVKMKSSEYY